MLFCLLAALVAAGPRAARRSRASWPRTPTRNGPGLDSLTWIASYLLTSCHSDEWFGDSPGLFPWPGLVRLGFGLEISVLWPQTGSAGRLLKRRCARDVASDSRRPQISSQALEMARFSDENGARCWLARGDGRFRRFPRLQVSAPQPLQGAIRPQMSSQRLEKIDSAPGFARAAAQKPTARVPHWRGSEAPIRIPSGVRRMVLAEPIAGPTTTLCPIASRSLIVSADMPRSMRSSSGQS